MKIGDPIKGELSEIASKPCAYIHVKYSFKKDLSRRIINTLYFGIDKIDLLEVIFSELSNENW